MSNKCGNCIRNSVSQISGNWNCKIKEEENDSMKKLQVKDLKRTILFDKVVVKSEQGDEEFNKKDCRLVNDLGFELFDIYGEHRLLAMDCDLLVEGQINMLVENKIGMK